MAQQTELECLTDGERLDRFVATRLEQYSRAQVQRWIRSGAVTVNGQLVRPSYRVAAGDAVLVRVPQHGQATLEPREMPLTVVYEDRDCVVIDKPPGLVVHPAQTLREPTLVHALLARYPEMREMVDAESEAGLRPGIVHRLDRDTSGLIVVARHRDARSDLQRQFRDRVVDKGYLALVHGRVRDARGRITVPVGRDPHNRRRMAVVPDGREAITEYVVQQYLFAPHGDREDYTLVDVRLLTGRTHQIRVHFAHTGHAVVGDSTYGRQKRRLACPRQFLHACRLGFHLPGDGDRVCFESPLPADLEGVLSYLRPVV